MLGRETTAEIACALWPTMEGPKGTLEIARGKMSQGGLDHLGLILVSMTRCRQLCPSLASTENGDLRFQCQWEIETSQELRRAIGRLRSLPGRFISNLCIGFIEARFPVSA